MILFVLEELKGECDFKIVVVSHDDTCDQWMIK